MRVTDLELAGLKLIELKIHQDERGFFTERFNAKAYQQNQLPTQYMQDNHSRSSPGVLRGLHFQLDPPQGKLVGVTRGRVFDVVVDIRKESPTFKQFFTIELTEDNGKLLWIPPGFAHGFYVLGTEPADVIYKVDALYNPATEQGIYWADPDLNIPWPIQGGATQPIVSKKDQHLPRFEPFFKRIN